MSRRQVRHLPRAFDGKALRIARLNTGLTQEQLAREIDVTLRTVQRWEDSLGQPNGSKLLALSLALSVSPEHLFRVEQAA